MFAGIYEVWVLQHHDTVFSYVLEWEFLRCYSGFATIGDIGDT